ncbi:transposable element Tcb2 transposase [Trichonephila clavipes]|nr:transposable element Tcb2 transposase [Trichonephila clavipes]
MGRTPDTIRRQSSHVKDLCDQILWYSKKKKTKTQVDRSPRKSSENKDKELRSAFLNFLQKAHFSIHWCAKIKDEVEKLAYQLNEEAEWTERPIRRLSRIIGKLEEGRSVTSVAAEFGIAHSIVSRLWRQFQTTGTAIRGFSSGHPRGTTPADDRYIVLQARRNRRQTAGEIARHTTQATGRPISRFTVARRRHGGGLFARRPVRCVPLTPAHRRRRSLWCREHRNWRDNEWGRVLFTDESRFSLSSDSHRILIWREREAAIIPRTSLKGTGMEVAVFSFGEASCLVVVQTFTSSTQVQSTGPVIVTRFFFHMCVFLEGL